MGQTNLPKAQLLRGRPDGDTYSIRSKRRALTNGAPASRSKNVEELLEERGLNVDHITVWRWVQDYGFEFEQRLRRHLKPTNKSWRVDETYVRVKGRWCYLYALATFIRK
jgi:transposase